MTLPLLKGKSIEEYLAYEDDSVEKHEYYQGEIFAMAGASFAHNEIASNVHTDIGTFLRNKSCRIYGSDLKVYIIKIHFLLIPISAFFASPRNF